jgi:nitric oxide reductase subunit C
MTKRQTRAFFYASSGVFALIFLALTVDTHRQVKELTHTDALTPQVLAGKHVWHEKDCINCHTLLGEGAYYAPVLTKIAQQRGPAYLRSFLQDPARFYSEQRDRRVMPNLHLTDAQIGDLIAFLTWVSHIDTNGWPPRPILVSGSAIPGADVGATAPVAASSDPVAQGQALFGQTPPGCNSCHSTAPGVSLVGPSLAGIALRAAQRVKSPDYRGSATDAAGYIRESIVEPNAYVVPGPTYSAGGQSLMPGNFRETLQPGQIDALVAYLMTLQ